MAKPENVCEKKAIPRGRGIYLLPTSLTLMGLFAGFYGIIAANNHDFAVAPITIFVAMFFDALDGRVARMTHTQSRFGAELDSLADMVTCGVAPSLIIYFWSLRSLGRVGWAIAFLYLVCVMLRLARFNAKQQSTDKRYFQGLPSPGGAGIVAGLVWFAYDNAIYGPNISVLAGLVTVFAALMMVSSIPYRSFKDFDAREKIPYMAIAVACVVLIFVLVNPPSVFFFGFLLFGLYGPLLRLWVMVHKRFFKRHA